ncbi:DUF5119 domain-containing protein [Bacteroides sp.]
MAFIQLEKTIAKVMRWKRILSIYMMTNLIYLCTGCERNELCYAHPHGSLWVDVDWSDLPEKLSPPEGVRISLYNGKESTTYRETYGGNIVSADGEHHLLVFNSDTEMILFRGMDKLGTAEAYLDVRTRTPYRNSPATKANSANGIYYSPLSRANSKTRSEELVGQPDRVFAAAVNTINVSYNATQTNDTVHVRPQSRVMFVNLTVRVRGIGNVRECRGSLSGVSRSYFLGQEAIGQETGTMIFDLEKNNNTYTQTVTVFGLVKSPEEVPVEERVQQIVSLEFLLVDNSVKTFEVDVQKDIKFDDLKPEVEIPIEVEQVVIPNVNPGSESGFDVDINDWGVQENIPITVGH